jgi:hypothetical protein
MMEQEKLIQDISYETDRKSTESFDELVVMEITDQFKFEKKLLRKIDLRLLPIILASFFVACLDRSNIGNARLAGIERDLNMNDQQFQIVLAMFFVGEVAMKIPSNLVIIFLFIFFFSKLSFKSVHYLCLLVSYYINSHHPYGSHL